MGPVHCFLVKYIPPNNMLGIRIWIMFMVRPKFKFDISSAQETHTTIFWYRIYSISTFYYWFTWRQLSLKRSSLMQKECKWSILEKHEAHLGVFWCQLNPWKNGVLPVLDSMLDLSPLTCNHLVLDCFTTLSSRSSSPITSQQSWVRNNFSTRPLNIVTHLDFSIQEFSIQNYKLKRRKIYW